MAVNASGIKAGKAFIIIDAVDATGKILNDVKVRFQQWGREISAIGQGLFTKALAITLPLGLSTKVFTDFDDMMRRVQIRTQGTAEEMAQLRKQALDLGRATAFSASQIGMLQGELAQRGFNRKDVLTITEPTMNLARAGGDGLDLGNDARLAAKLVGGTIREFKLEAKDAGRVADVLATAINYSNFALEDMIVALQYAGPASEHFGISLESTVASLAALRDLNIDASIAGTAYRNMLTYLSDADSRNKFNERLESMTGKTVEFVDAAKNLKPLPAILFAMSKATEGMGTADRANLFHNIFGTRAEMPAAALGNAATRYEELMSYFALADDMAKTMAEGLEQGLGGAFRETLSSIEDIAIALGEALEVGLTTVTRRAVGLLHVLSQWIRDNKGLVSTVISLVAGNLTLGAAILGVGVAITFMSSSFQIMAKLTYPIALLLQLLKLTILLPVYLFTATRSMLVFAWSTIYAATSGVFALSRYLINLATIITTRVITSIMWMSSTIISSIIPAFTRLIGTIISTTYQLVLSSITWTVSITQIVSTLTAQIVSMVAAFDTAVFIGALTVLLDSVLFVVNGIMMLEAAVASFIALGPAGMVAAVVAVSVALLAISLIIGLVISSVLLFAKAWSTAISSVVSGINYLLSGFVYVGQEIAKHLSMLWQHAQEMAYRIADILQIAFRGITSAVEIGDIESAFKISTIVMKIVWLELLNSLKTGWDYFMNYFENAMTFFVVWIEEARQAYISLSRTIATLAGPASKALFEMVLSGLGKVGEITPYTPSNVILTPEQNKNKLAREKEITDLKESLLALTEEIEDANKSARKDFMSGGPNVELDPSYLKGMYEDLVRGGGANLQTSAPANVGVIAGTLEAFKAAAENRDNAEKNKLEMEKAKVDALKSIDDMTKKLEPIDRNIARIALIEAV